MRQLNDSIAGQSNRTKHNSFNDIRLNFELKAYEARLLYLQDLQVDLRRGKTKGNPQERVDEYFEDVFADVEGDNKKLNDLTDLFDHYADNTRIKLKINNLEKDLEALRKVIDSKERCRVRKHRPIDPHNKK